MPRSSSPTILTLAPRVLRNTLRVLYRERVRLDRRIRSLEQRRRGFVRLDAVRP